MIQRDWKRALLGGGAGCLLALLVLWPTLLDLTSSWQRNQSYQYGWLVLPMVVYLLGWHNRPETLAASPTPDFSGVAVSAGAAVCWGAAALMNIDVGRQFALILALQGIVLSSLGWRSYWTLFPTLALMFLMVPSGDLFQPALRILTVRMIELFAVIARLPHKSDGFVVSIGDNDYIVLDECAGLPYFILATFLGYCFGLMLYRSVFKIAALAIFGAFIGILSNGLRVSAIVWIDWIQGSQMQLTAHGHFQWLALFVALGLLFLVLGKLAANPAPVPPARASMPPTSPARPLAPVVAGLSVLLIAGTVTWLASGTPQQPRITQAERLPQNIVGWELISRSPAWSLDQLHHTESLTLTYRRNQQDLRVVIVETLAADAKLQESELAPGDTSIWHQNKFENHESCGTSGCLTLLHTTWENGKTEQRRHVYSAYGINGFATNSKLALRAAHGWNRLTGSDRNARLIGFTFDAAATAPVIDELATFFRMLQTGLDAG